MAAADLCDECQPGGVLYEYARAILEHDFDDLNYDPRMILRSMGWDLSKFPHVDELKGKMTWTGQDVRDLALAFQKEGDIDSYEDAVYSDVASDFTANLMAEVIQKTYAEHVRTRKR